MSEKQEAIERLQALELRSGGSHEMLSSIAKAIYEPTYGGWTIGACQVLRDTLVNLLSETDVLDAPSGRRITDELRSFTKDPLLGYASQSQHIEQLTAIADRIDAAHESEIGRAAQLLADAEKDRDLNYANWQDCKQKVLQHNITMDELSAEIERLKDELAHRIELPKDADGEYIHVGDELQWTDDTDPFVAKVSYLQLNPDGGWYLGIRSRGLCYAPNLLSHYHAPTVEDVLREFAQKMNENMGMYTGEAIDADEWQQADSKTIAEYAAKLRLAGDGKEQ